MTDLGGICVVVNADDLGLSPSVNGAIAFCFDEGLISSATAMANMPCLGEACELARARGWLERVGVHVNLSEGPALSDEMRGSSRFCDADGRFILGRCRPGYLAPSDRRRIACEVAAQVATCRHAGIVPSHADSHHHFHTGPLIIGPVAGALRAAGVAALRLGRNLAPASRRGPKGMYKRWLNWRIRRLGFASTRHFSDLDEFVAARKRRELAAATYEVMVHPDYDEAGRLIDAVDGRPLPERLREALSGCTIIPYPC